MKITQQLIAAASFASLLFAPLAQAQTSDSATGNVELTVLGSGLSFEARDLNFGSVTPGSDTNNLVVACAAADSAAGTASISGGAADAVATGAATCGVITVTGGSSSITYALTVEVNPLTDGSGNSISPTFKVFATDGTTEIAGLNAIAADTTATASSTRSIGARAEQVYKLGGSAPIATNQTIGTYTGTYIVSATVS